MSVTYELLCKLRDAAEEANDTFDILAFEQEAFPCGGDCIGTDLAANLDYLREELRNLCADYYGAVA